MASTEILHGQKHTEALLDRPITTLCLRTNDHLPKHRCLWPLWLASGRGAPFSIPNKRYCTDLWHLSFGKEYTRLSMPEHWCYLLLWRWCKACTPPSIKEFRSLWYEDGQVFWQQSLKNKKYEFLVIEGHQFSHPGVYTLKLEHFMRTDTLSGL